MPGWPAEVPLPIDPEWKKDYAASVRRLIRDGVDAPLANLFVHAARSPTPDAEGVNRARSVEYALPAATFSMTVWDGVKCESRPRKCLSSASDTCAPAR